MNVANERVDFYFDGGSVGCFKAEDCPIASSIVSYMPYRSVSHLAMGRMVKAAGFAVCHYQWEGRSIEFRVIDCSEYGRLKIEIRSED